MTSPGSSAPGPPGSLGDILVAEDDPKQAELVRLYLERDGYRVNVVGDGLSALREADRHRPDLAVLDVMMPGLDGLEVCRRLDDNDVPVILLTSRSTEADVLLGLQLGADDYVTKPYSPRELVARVRTVLRRRTRASAVGAVLEAHGLRLDLERHELTVEGEGVELTPAEFDLLTVLLGRPGQVFSRRQLLERLHGGADYLTERSVDSHVMKLRKKIEPDPGRPVRLVTVYGIGYKLTDRVPDGRGS